MVTITGLVLNIGVAIIFIVGGEEGNRGDLSYVGWAGALILFAGLFDMLDGQVARLGNMSSIYGALFDSVLDRYSELFMFLGICYYLVAHHYFISSLITFIALIGSMMVSYTRARAEGLGIESKGGLMQRPERIITVSLAAIACGITAHFLGGNYKLFLKGISFHVFEPMTVFIIPLTLLAVLTNVTAINRLVEAGKALKKRKSLPVIPIVNKQQPAKKIFTGMLVLIVLLSAFTPPPMRSMLNELPASNPSDSFPVPSGITNQLFYLQRTHNINTIVCALNLKRDGQPDVENPVHVFWIRYTEQGQLAELSFIQRMFAYGVKTKFIGNGSYELRFVSYKKYPMFLKRSESDKKYHVYATIAKREAILQKIFIKINGGSFWSPNIEYIELQGTDPVDGHEISQRMKV
jgi:phosphatidylglycerophosphate synthase